MKKILYRVLPILILCTMLLSFVGCSQKTSTSNTLQKVNFLLNWTVTGDHSPYYVALKKGWFKDAGLDVNIIIGKGSGYSVQAVDSGTADIAISDAPVPISSRQSGAKVKIVGIIFDKHPDNTYFWSDGSIKQPKDLAGKTVAVPATDGHKVMWPAFAKQIGIDPNSVKFVDIDPTAKVSALATKKVDAVFDLYTGLPFYQAAMPSDKIGNFLWSDYGFKCYAHSYIVNDSTIKNNPDMIRKFLDVAYKAWEYTANHPQEAIDILAESQPINKTDYLGNLNICLSFIKTDRFRKNGIGYIDSDQIKATYDLVNQYQAKLSFPVKDCYDNSFLPKKPYKGF